MKHNTKGKNSSREMELLMDKNKLNLQKCKIREVGENIIQTTRELIVPKVSIIFKKKRG